ncbi:Bug family tripartite tricarboxylate transporter substrate binding protein [Limnohabitans lacus]|uniref:Tripartite tricarboxylate transporter substrate binding protein n=1 Tax=Limnohabitans lacus TaxID=3045173 RepID=A0ABT6X309_9BURK|nr:tripartite tricarboxylate transporter substrate binding protein [Limnohabitans sp. HM2-2]MDI9232508.1 tripartite tricarboxylate transporter substrate binding protein [Limnohabitans sp. HM2-2]
MPTFSIRPMAAAALLLLSMGVHAADYPVQSIRVVVPFPAGGSTDLVTRALAVELGAVLKQSVVVDNKAGAGSLLGSELVSKAPADGYTLLMAGLTNVFLPYVHKNLRFHPVDDFANIGLVADLPNVIAVNASMPYKKLDELIKAEKAKPKTINFASAGVATPSHLVCEMVNFQTGSQFEHVPYKGNAPAVADLMGGHIPVMCNNLGGTLPYMNSGQIRILAQTGKTRSAAVPDVPTFAELGISGLEAGLWMGLVAPKGTPAEVIKTLNAALAKAMTSPALKDKLQQLGATPLPTSVSAFDDRVRQDRKAWDPMLGKLNLSGN